MKSFNSNYIGLRLNSKPNWVKLLNQEKNSLLTLFSQFNLKKCGFYYNIWDYMLENEKSRMKGGL